MTGALNARGLRAVSEMLEGGALASVVHFASGRKDVWTFVLQTLAVWAHCAAPEEKAAPTPLPKTAPLAWAAFEASGTFPATFAFAHAAHAKDPDALSLFGALEPCLVAVKYTTRCRTSAKGWLQQLERLAFLASYVSFVADIASDIIAPTDPARSAAPAVASPTKSTQSTPSAAASAAAPPAAAVPPAPAAAGSQTAAAIDALAGTLPARVTKSPAPWWSASLDAAVVIGFLKYGQNKAGYVPIRGFYLPLHFK